MDVGRRTGFPGPWIDPGFENVEDRRLVSGCGDVASAAAKARCQVPLEREEVAHARGVGHRRKQVGFPARATGRCAPVLRRRANRALGRAGTVARARGPTSSRARIDYPRIVPRNGRWPRAAKDSRVAEEDVLQSLTCDCLSRLPLVYRRSVLDERPQQPFRDHWL